MRPPPKSARHAKLRTYEDAVEVKGGTWGRPPPTVLDNRGKEKIEEKIFSSISRRLAAEDPANHREDSSRQGQHVRRSRRGGWFSRPRPFGGTGASRLARRPMAARLRLRRRDQTDRRARIRTTLPPAERRRRFSGKESRYEATRAQMETTTNPVGPGALAWAGEQRSPTALGTKTGPRGRGRPRLHELSLEPLVDLHLITLHQFVGFAGHTHDRH